MVLFAADDFGTDHMRARSELAKRIRGLVRLDDFLIVDDEAADAKWLISSLKLVCGHDVEIRHVRTAGTMIDALRARLPKLMFLDDRLSPVDNATSTLPLVRKTGYEGPVVIVSGALTKARRADLLRLGAAAILHKDEIESTRVAELLLQIFGPEDGTPSP